MGRPLLCVDGSGGWSGENGMRAGEDTQSRTSEHTLESEGGVGEL